MITYTLNRSSRKTIALYIRHGIVEVRAPLRASKRDIDQFVQSKEKWIADKLNKANELSAQRQNFALNYGSILQYCGKEYPIAIRQGTRAGFDGECFYMPPGLDEIQIKQTCIRVYRMLAKHYITKRVSEFAKHMRVMPASVKINSAKTRWGSCSGKKNLNFSWRLIMAGEDVIDYVIVHELAHLIEMNHSNAFWNNVEKVLPDYRQRQSRLKELQVKLSREDWD